MSAVAVPRPAADRRRLAEMGIDLYCLRGARAPSAHPARSVVAAAAANSPASTRPAANRPRARVAVLIEPDSARTLVTAVARTLRMTGLEAIQIDATALAIAPPQGLVAFGSECARAAGAALPTAVQERMAWVVQPALSELIGDSTAKRGLWSELRRLRRAIGNAGAAPSA